MSFLKTVEGWFGIGTPATTNVVTTAENAYQALLKDEQNAAAFMSGGLAIINNNIAIDSKLVAPIIASVFPNFPLTDITNGFITLASTLTTVQSEIPTTLEGAISLIQAYLKPKQGNDWIIAVQGLVSLGATLISPVTPIQKFVSVIQYVYDDIITPLLGLHKSAPVATVNAPSIDVTNASNPVSVAAPASQDATKG